MHRLISIVVKLGGGFGKKTPEENTKMMHRYPLSSNNMMSFVEIKLTDFYHYRSKINITDRVFILFTTI